MCEVFFPASENTHQNLTSSIQSRILNSRLKAQCASHVNTQLLEEGSGAGGSKVTCVFVNITLINLYVICNFEHL